MHLTVKQYDILVKLNSIIYEHKEVLNEEEVEIMENANEVLADVYDKHLASNKRTADYIANKRLTDKNYCRGVSKK